MYGEEEEKITLDKQAFKALASDTRIGMLKSLNVRRKTLSELAKEHGMSVSTVKEHLDNLVRAGLIVQKDEGHKWKYYELTRSGKAVLNPEEKKIWIMLSVSLLALLATGIDMASGALRGLFYGFYANMVNAAYNTPKMAAGQDLVVRAPEAGVPMLGSGSSASIAEAQPVPWIHIALIIIFAAAVAYLTFRIVKARRSLR